MDLIDCLCNSRKISGDRDIYKSSGITLASSLKEVEQAAGLMIQNLINRKLKANQFIDHCNLKHFHDNEDKQTVFYTLAGHRDRYGLTYQFGYNVFGLAFYNFRLKVVEDGKCFKTALGNTEVKDAKSKNLEGFRYISSKRGTPVMYSAENRNSNEAEQSTYMESVITTSQSNSIDSAKEFSFTEMIGVSAKLSDILKISELAVEFGFSASEVISTAYSETKEVSKTKTRGLTTTAPIPPHTEVTFVQNEEDTVMSIDYDCPVMIQFDVAVFSMCGTCYDDNAAVHTLDTAGYDQRSFVTLFQPSVNGEAGEDGSENLYIRYRNFNKVNGYDKNHGITELKSHDDGTLSTSLNWKKILSQPEASTEYKGAANDARTEQAETLIQNLCLNRPMSVAGGTLTESGNAMHIEIKPAVPLFALATIELRADKKSYDVGINDMLYPENWTVDGYDKHGVPFYGFDYKKGEWILVDENDNRLKDDTPARIYTDNSKKLVSFQGIKAGVIYAKYLISDNVYTSKEGTKITNDNIKSVKVKITIHDTRLQGRITATGCVDVKPNTVTNLETLDTLYVHVYDEQGREICVPVIWEAADDCKDKIKIEHNRLSANFEGSFKIRPTYEDLVTDNWIEVLVKK